MYRSSRQINLMAALRGRPGATALLAGSEAYPDIAGRVQLYTTTRGVLVLAEVNGLPGATGACDAPIFGFHIHSGGACVGNATDPFAAAMTHYDPRGCRHPYHAGDLPPLFGNGGYAFSLFLTDRFTVEEVIGKTVIIHAHPDDFSSQPAGNPGGKIACGVIVS